jgi:hypothetical protein
VLLLVVELLSFKYARDEDLVGYEARDTRTSLTMGGGNVVINAVWKLVVVARPRLVTRRQRGRHAGVSVELVAYRATNSTRQGCRRWWVQAPPLFM